MHPADKRLTVQFRTIDKRNSESNIRSNEATPDRDVSAAAGEEMGSCRKWERERPPVRGFPLDLFGGRCSAICDAEHDLSLRGM